VVVGLTGSEQLQELLVELVEKPGQASPTTISARTAAALGRIRELEDRCRRQTEALRDAAAATPSLSFLNRALACSTGTLEAWGEVPQERMVHEELGELSTVLARNSRGRASEGNVLEECADAILVAIEAARLVDATAGDLAAVVELKLRRAEQRVADALWEKGVEELDEVGRAIVEEQLDVDLDEGGRVTCARRG
jgi:hypothetical protein